MSEVTSETLGERESLAALAELAAKAKRSQASAESVTSERPSTRGPISPAMEAQVRQLFQPDSWRPIVRAPFQIGEANTGRKCWRLQPEEETTLATTTCMTAEFFLQVDPKWVALILFSFNWFTILGAKALQNNLEQQAEQREREALGLKNAT